MTPCLSLDNQPYVCVVNIERLRQGKSIFALGKALAYLPYILLGNLCCANGFAVLLWRERAASLIEHVIDVVQVRAKKQMSWIYTGGIVALVKAMQALWNVAMVKFPGKSVCEIAATTHRKHSVAKLLPARLPFPTFIRAALVHPLPESILSRAQRSNFVVMARDKACRLSDYVAVLRIVSLGNGSGLSASTFAEFWSILGAHRKFTFLMSCSGIVTSNRRGFLRGFTGLSISQVGAT